MRCAYISLCLLAALASGITQSSADVLTRGNHQDPASLDPHRISTVYEQNIILDLFEGLTSPDASGRPTPAAAESWSVSDDGLTWTFLLRPNQKWSDGVPLTADDVVYSFQRLLNPVTASQYPYLFHAIENAEAITRGSKLVTDLGVRASSTHEVKITLNSPAPFLPELLSNGFAVLVPKHVIEAQDDAWTAPGTMVSNGAYTLKDWRPQDRVKLIANPLHRDLAELFFEHVTYLPTEDQSAAVAQFRAGALDSSLEFPTARTPWLLENLPGETRIADYLITFYLTFNTEHPVLADVRIRQALSLAIDRELLADRVLRSGERPAYSFVPPAVVGYEPPRSDATSWTMVKRRAKASELLAAAGYGPDSPLRLTYSLSSAEDRRRVAAAITAMWRPLGVEVELNNTEGKVLFSRLRSGDFEIGYAGWAADVNDAANFLAVLQSTSTTSNYARYRNPQYDLLLKDATQAIDYGTRAQLLAQAEALLLTDTPIAPLFHGVSKNLVSQQIIGWIDNPRDVHLSRYLKRDPNVSKVD